MLIVPSIDILANRSFGKGMRLITCPSLWPCKFRTRVISLRLQILIAFSEDPILNRFESPDLNIIDIDYDELFWNKSPAYQDLAYKVIPFQRQNHGASEIADRAIRDAERAAERESRADNSTTLSQSDKDAIRLLELDLISYKTGLFALIGAEQDAERAARVEAARARRLARGRPQSQNESDDSRSYKNLEGEIHFTLLLMMSLLDFI